MIFITNDDGSAGMKQGLCPNRAESPAINAMSRSLGLMKTIFVMRLILFRIARRIHLGNMMNKCHNVSANR